MFLCQDCTRQNFALRPFTRKIKGKYVSLNLGSIKRLKLFFHCIYLTIKFLDSNAFSIDAGVLMRDRVCISSSRKLLHVIKAYNAYNPLSYNSKPYFLLHMHLLVSHLEATTVEYFLVALQSLS